MRRPSECQESLHNMHRLCACVGQRWQPPEAGSNPPCACFVVPPPTHTHAHVNTHSRSRYIAFGGSGNTLGGSGGASTSAAPHPAAPAGEWEGVDEGKPTTSLQLRLADGSRLVARFNHTHVSGGAGFCRLWCLEKQPLQLFCVGQLFAALPRVVHTSVNLTPPLHRTHTHIHRPSPTCAASSARRAQI